MIIKTTIADLRSNLASYLSEVFYKGKTVKIYKYGQLLGELNPPTPASESKKDYMRYYGMFKNRSKETGIEYENRVRRNKAERDRVRKLRNREDYG